ncbi:hypothetical protein BDV96DRAFT_645414 [Lophiotrema nucula]|uniref:Glycosyltransferase family 25 protein n=1 Tax=Lophiotrema nucula TaxID=690887 RepID=A0A6A5ZAE9_9PLEO|nr:hypothetical protein BDV96DRAFT_645414 [Lophiotrema nucula]
MPSLSHGRACLAVAFGFILFFLVLKLQYAIHSPTSFSFTTQYSRPSNSRTHGVSNDTLGFQKIFVINAPWRSDRKDSIALAASYTGISLDWIPGVSVEDMQDKAYPPGNHRTVSPGNKGSWRAHMNAIRTVIERNLTTALIMEDDGDWDLRIREQLEVFGKGTRKMPELIAKAERQVTLQPPSWDTKLDRKELAKRSSIDLSSLSSRDDTNNVYGSDWDVLWLGHCGAELPPPALNSPNRILIPNDDTVPSPQHLKPMRSAPLDPISTLYPPHTRVLHHLNHTLCTIAYAVTQRGARKILYEFGVREFSKGYDFALSDFCNGLTRGSRRETMPVCIGVNPPLFSHWFGDGRGGSDIMGVGSGGRETGSRYVRWSVRRNLERLGTGEGVEESWGDPSDEERRGG